jgi:hypothetical protein
MKLFIHFYIILAKFVISRKNPALDENERKHNMPAWLIGRVMKCSSVAVSLLHHTCSVLQWAILTFIVLVVTIQKLIEQSETKADES